jgi:hypothetical protein
MFKEVVKNIYGCLVFFFSCFVNSQIWLNFFMDDHHFMQITKLGGKKKTKQTNKHVSLLQIMGLVHWNVSIKHL